MRVLFLYDDRERTTPAVRQVIGVERYSAIVFRKQRLVDIVRDLLGQVPDVEFVSIASEADAAAMMETLEHVAEDVLVLRLPSCFAPRERELFAQIVRKLRYAPGPAMFSQRIDGEAVALLSRHDTLAVLRAPRGEERRAFFRDLTRRVLVVDNIGGFHDLRDVKGFLGFMIGATEARHFNKVDVEGSVYRKSSRDKAKMRAEYRFFHVAPEAMKRFLLPTFGFVETADAASYAMERMAVPDAALQLVHHSFNPRTFGNLLDLFLEFDATRERRPMGVAAVRQAAREGVLQKTERRLKQLMETPVGIELDRLMGAAGPIGSLADVAARGLRLLERAIERDRTDYLALSHGDPCFSNILYNQDLSLFRLIDPRGGDTAEDCLMHPLYDIAKFSHSVLGGYDFINNGLFELRLDKANRLVLDLEGGGPPAWMRDAFLARIEAAGYSPRLMRTFEMSLFLSMLPLHVDMPRKLPAFCLTACDLIMQLENER